MYSYNKYTRTIATAFKRENVKLYHNHAYTVIDLTRTLHLQLTILGKRSKFPIWASQFNFN